MLSALIIAKNEEDEIASAIKSVSFCDEVVVINNNSSDNTAKIARTSGALVFPDDANSFATLRNHAENHAQGDWLLYIDADEHVSNELKQEILSAIKSQPEKRNQFSAYRLKRRDFFWGKELKYGEIARARSHGIIRLMKKGSGTWRGTVHEEFITEKPVGCLQSYLDHYPHPTISAFLTEINVYSTLRAQELYKAGFKASVVDIVLYPFLKFNYTYFLRLGFLDGPAGYVYSFMLSFHSFLVRSKLYMLTHPSRK